MINSLRVIRAMINKEKTDILRNKKDAFFAVSKYYEKMKS